MRTNEDRHVVYVQPARRSGAGWPVWLALFVLMIVGVGFLVAMAPYISDGLRFLAQMNMDDSIVITVATPTGSAPTSPAASAPANGGGFIVATSSAPTAVPQSPAVNQAQPVQPVQAVATSPAAGAVQLPTVQAQPVTAVQPDRAAACATAAAAGRRASPGCAENRPEATAVPGAGR